ncbi:Putative RING-type E3 ubiquitin transferase C3H69 [Linum perenne]
MSKRVLCKFFAHGACLKGEHCEYSHDWKDPSSNVCTFYQKGKCSYGSRCRYDHVKLSRPQSAASSSTTIPHGNVRVGSNGVTTVPGFPSDLSPGSRSFLPSSLPTWRLESGERELSEHDDIVELENVKPSDRPICSFAAAGECPRGDQCLHIHGDLCPTCGKNCLHPFRPDEKEEHLRTCEKKQKHLDALKQSQEIECCVCLEKVLSKQAAAERKFGLLSECDHPFCIGCIRNWRSISPTSGMDPTSMSRTCPVCRKLSYFVVPSVIWYSTQEEKKEIIDSYKAKLSLIDCKHFNFGNGNCPFGSSCFYKHHVKPGSYVWKNHRPPPRRPRPRRPNAVDLDQFYIEQILAEDDPWDTEIFDYDDFCDPFNPEYLDDDDFPYLDTEDISSFRMAFLLAGLSSTSADLSSDEDDY